MNISRFLKNPLITGTLLMTASGIASRIIGFFYRIFLAQTIGAEALGIYQLIAPVFAMCFALTASSIQTSISKFVGDACGKNAGTSQGEITARGYLLLGLVISCTASVIVGIFLYTQADWIALHFLGEPRCAPLLSLLSFSMLPCCIHACINGYYYGMQKARVPAFSQVAEQAIRMGAEVFHALAKLLKGRGLSTAVGDEGGFAPALNGIEDALDSICQAIRDAGYEPGKDVTIAMDCAASEFAVQENGQWFYDYRQLKDGKKKDPNGRKLTADEQIKYLEELITKYPIDSIEDGLDENDWDNWVKLTAAIGDRPKA